MAFSIFPSRKQSPHRKMRANQRHQTPEGLAMNPPIAVQLYSVRATRARLRWRHSPNRRHGLCRRRDSRFPRHNASCCRGLFRDLGLTVCSAHLPLPTRQNEAEVFDTLALLGCNRAVCAWMPADRFGSLKEIRKVCDELNAGAELAAAHGVTLYYHNHWWELHLVKGKPALWRMVDVLDPAVHFEIDTYWVRTGGVNPSSCCANSASALHCCTSRTAPARRRTPWWPWVTA